jgi:23S rRNA G2069 N7-methylase RlmK/C1962 C5-methylase RlmI
VSALETAWQKREKLGLFGETEALRVFHGPGEGTGALRDWAIDRFGGHYWVTFWAAGPAPGATSKAGSMPKDASGDARTLEEITAFLRGKGARSVVWLGRPEQGVPALPKVAWGEPPAGRFEVREGEARFWVQLLEARHPGLFLDHAPLRRWLEANVRGMSVLNAFAYTGSLSVACGLGGASHVTTLDLSKPTVRWAEENWGLNGLDPAHARFIAGDVFEWLPRLKREAKRFGCVILDPPSFSRGKKATFSTAKDLKKLHVLALALLGDAGYLVTSINSANVAWRKYEADVQAAARESGVSLEVLRKIEQPPSFPPDPRRVETAYLKGWVFRATRRSRGGEPGLS